MRLRDLTPTEAGDVAVLRHRLRAAHGPEADTAPYLTDWLTRPCQGGGFRLHGLCWGSSVGDVIMTTSRVVEMTDAYARTETGSLYCLGTEDREHRRKRAIRGQRGPLVVAPAPEPEASPQP